ncbi:hypothetical protein [Enterobacter hormaechei]|uniref:hypothetical protein n=1 Tax=Enterobacter hormaechei TaxID=158836 RepID=UPI0023E44598|nr:hypothetical protein [Enterobacter hormaechei]MDF3686162.1 hypothetical protein [Enterobacter hormaechei]
MEYDVDIQITKLVRGRGLCKEMLSDQDSDEEVAMVIAEQQEERNVNGPKSWMDNMKNFLSGNGYPQGLDRAKRRQYRLQSIPYVVIDDILFRRDFNGTLLRCIEEDQAERMIKELHDGPDGGHFSARTTAIKIDPTKWSHRKTENSNQQWSHSEKIGPLTMDERKKDI